MNEIVVIEGKSEFNGEVYYRLKLQNIDPDSFQTVIKILKNNGGFYISQVKRWFIRQENAEHLKSDLEPVTARARDIEKITHALIEETYKELQPDSDIEEPYGDEFRALRSSVYKASNGKCAVCGNMANVCHHVRPISFNGENSESNLVLLCGQCHGKLHAFYRTRAQQVCVDLNPDYFRDCLKELKLTMRSLVK